MRIEGFVLWLGAYHTYVRSVAHKQKTTETCDKSKQKNEDRVNDIWGIVQPRMIMDVIK